MNWRMTQQAALKMVSFEAAVIREYGVLPLRQRAKASSSNPPSEREPS